MMGEDLILEPVSTNANRKIRLPWKTNGLFSKKEARKAAKDDDFERNVDDCLAADLNHNLLLPMPYAELPQCNIQANAELDIPEPIALDESEWDLGNFDVENNIQCEIFSELSDLLTTSSADEVTWLRPEMTAHLSKPCDQESVKSSVSESSPMATAPSVVASNVCDHNYAAVVPESRDTCHAIEDENGVTRRSDLLKTMKYVERRKKNNLASRRSRETRKRKYAETEEQLFHLERKNAQLRNRIAEMERLSCAMKRSVFGKIDVADSLSG